MMRKMNKEVVRWKDVKDIDVLSDNYEFKEEVTDEEIEKLITWDQTKDRLLHGVKAMLRFDSHRPELIQLFLHKQDCMVVMHYIESCDHRFDITMCDDHGMAEKMLENVKLRKR